MDSKAIYIAYLCVQLNSKEAMYLSHMKYHKLLYFSLAYSLAYFEEENLFKDLIFEAWVNGPVEASIRKEILYNNLGSIRNYITPDSDEIMNFDLLSDNEKKSIEMVVKIMEEISVYGLSQLTHEDIFTEDKTPWKKANPEEKSCNTIINRSEIKGFYTKEWFETFKENQTIIVEQINERFK